MGVGSVSWPPTLAVHHLVDMQHVTLENANTSKDTHDVRPCGPIAYDDEFDMNTNHKLEGLAHDCMCML